MASVTLSSGVVVGHQSLVTNGAYTGYDLTKNGSFPSSGYRITGAVLHCTLRNAVWDTITVKAADGTTLGSFGAVGTNGERTCALTTSYDYAKLTHITLYGGGVGTQIASGSYVTIEVTWQYTASKLTLSASAVYAGGSVTANISAQSSSYSHKVTLTLGDKSQQWTVAAGVLSQTVTVPVAWVDQLGEAASKTAAVKLTTLLAGSAVGEASASLTVKAPASKLTLSAATVDAGDSVTANISAYSAAFSHRVTLAFGSRSQSWNVSAGTASLTVTVSLAWLDQIPRAASGTGTVTLYTLSGGNTIGQASASLTIRAPQSTAPTFTASCAPLLTVGGVTYPSMGSGVYVQSKSGCTAKITGASAKYGATVKGYSIRGGGYSGTNATLATGLLGNSGTAPFVFRVTDSRGLYTEKTVNISVLAYAPPRITSVTGWRVNSAGNTDPSGTLGKLKSSWSYTSLNGANTCGGRAYIKPAGGSETVLKGSMVSGSTYWVATSAGNMTLPVTTNYELRLELTDKYGTVSMSGTLPSADFAVHLNAAGNSIAFGKACERSNTVEIAESRTLWYKGASFTGLLGMVGTGYNLNEDVTAGVYLLTSSTENVPEGVANGICVNFLSRFQAHNFTDNWLWQLVFDAWSKKAFLRRKLNDSDFTAWEPFGSGLEAYPVGSIYMSYIADSPAKLFGGTWTPIWNRFLVGAGNSYERGEEGGADAIKLTVSQMPAHTHTVQFARSLGSTVSWTTASGIGRYSGDAGGAAFTMATGSAGSGSSFDNRPRYFAVYMWRRTA